MELLEVIGFYCIGKVFISNKILKKAVRVAKERKGQLSHERIKEHSWALGITWREAQVQSLITVIRNTLL